MINAGARTDSTVLLVCLSKVINWPVSCYLPRSLFTDEALHGNKPISVVLVRKLSKSGSHAALSPGVGARSATFPIETSVTEYESIYLDTVYQDGAALSSAEWVSSG